MTSKSRSQSPDSNLRTQALESRAQEPSTQFLTFWSCERKWNLLSAKFWARIRAGPGLGDVALITVPPNCGLGYLLTV